MLISFSPAGQQEQIVDAYGKVAGAVANVLRGGFRAPDDGVLSVLYAATAPELREGKFPNATYFSDPAEDGKPTSEGTDEEVRFRCTLLNPSEPAADRYYDNSSATTSGKPVSRLSRRSSAWKTLVLSPEMRLLPPFSPCR